MNYFANYIDNYCAVSSASNTAMMCSRAVTKKQSARRRMLFSLLYFSYGMHVLSSGRSPSRHVFSFSFLFFLFAYRPLVVWIFRVWNWGDGYANAFEVAEFPSSRASDLPSH